MTAHRDLEVAAPGSPLASPRGKAAHVAEQRHPPPVARVRVFRWSVLVGLVAFAVLVANHPGQMVFDTKLSVDLDPAGYYASLWHLWDPLSTLGTLNNQAIGYAMPMAPFYLAGHLAHVPVWLTERLWMSLIIAVGFAGLVKLAGALGIGSPGSRFFGGVVFALWPTFTILIGSTSAAVLPGMLAPWAVLPLVPAVLGPDGPGSSRGGWRGYLWPAARSGAVVLCMGGVNATSTIDGLLLPALFILTYARGRRLVWTALTWGAAVTAAAAWWAVPLLLQGKYAFNFLPYVEQAATTTATTSAAATLRGTGNWVAYFNLGTPWLPAGWTMVTNPVAILASAAAAAGGLYGLARRRMPGGTWLRLSAGLAAAALLAGYGGPLGGPAHGPVQRLLDGTLAPFRNVYKLEPVIAVALALGLAYAAADWLRGAAGPPHTRPTALAARVLLALAVTGLAVPYLSGQILNPGPFTAVPRYWHQVAAFLAANSPRNTAMVVPADVHGDYVWGDPIDDPLEALATSPWAAAGLVPYGGAGSQSLLQTAEQAVESGQQVTGLAAYLNRAGIRYLVVRNDLDPRQIGYTAPAIVHRTLAQSGFGRVASFGPPVAGYPAVEVYAAAGPPPSPVATLPVSQTMLVNGGPDSLLQLAGQHLLGPGQAAVIAGDQLPAPPSQWAVTDGQRRADTAFGLVNSNVSYTYTANETNPSDDQLGGAGGPPRQLLPVPAAGHQTVAVLSGAAQVSVSSYGSWLADTQQEDPVSAFDGNPATAWAEGSATTPAGQWIQITFDHQVDLPASVGIRLLNDSAAREITDQLRVSTAAGSTTTPVAPVSDTQPLSVVPGPTRWLRITITGASNVVPGAPGAGISDVLIPGVRVTRLLQPAQDPAGQQAPAVTFSFHQQVPSPLTLVSPAAAPALARTFSTAQPAEEQLGASALAVPGQKLDAILDQIPPPAKGVLQVTVTSTPGSLPSRFPASLLAGSGSQAWSADTAQPVIHLSWRGKRRISSVLVQAATGLTAPVTVKITSPQGNREGIIGYGGLVRFKRPLTTDRIDVSFPNVQQVSTVSSTGQVGTVPVGLSRLFVPALAGLRAATPDPATRFTLACGKGPALTIDGQVYQTSVSGTIGQLTQFLPVRVDACTLDSTVPLGAGQHTLTAAAPGAFAVTDLSLSSTEAATQAAAQGRSVTIQSWHSDQRQVRVGPGPAAYLEIHENYNQGWSATLNGRTLRPVRLDGWQQGFVVPAGAAGLVALSFRPAPSYHLALAGSVLALLILLALVAWSFAERRNRAGHPGPGQQGSRRPVRPATRPAPAAGAGIAARWLGSLGVIALVAVAGGPVVLATGALGLLAWRWPRWLPAVAFSGMALAGLIAAAPAQPTAPGQGVFGGPAQAAALIALAAALLPATIRFRPPPAEVPELLPAPRRAFGIVDELSCYFDSAAEPNNVHLEVWLPGNLDAGRLREAVTAVLAAEPRARGRRVPGAPWQLGYQWEYPAREDRDPVTVTTFQTDAELDLARARFLALAPPLDKSPPFHLLLASGPDRESLILNAHHAAFDGHSCLWLLSKIADQYGDGAARPAQAEEADETTQPTAAVARGSGRRPRRAARIAPRGGRSNAPGYGFALLGWPDVPVPPRHEGTVNDLLVAALIEAIRRWNASHGPARNARRRIRISMPADARPPGAGQELGNLSRLCTVTAAPGRGTGADLVAMVAAQTRAAKSNPGPQVDPILTAAATARLPVAVKRRLLRLAVRRAAWLTADTSLISNLGKVTGQLSFGELSPTRTWFSTSAHMPRGLAVGAITVDGRLQLCFRYRLALLDEAAAAEFAAGYAAALSGLAAR